ncbi:hypothetical protein Anas_14489 [Armadillidium nasatum]|uniref:Uncharacterized protein n=1 Tax=Armadillidium nasatum TaxID=96803 RepID=A0A5N5T2T9_9CRUS|nr:hypothetical protein Anas_14489 [Armadillidium nasatum]
MELMVHRRLLYDDAFGVGEALNETAFGEEPFAKQYSSIKYSDSNLRTLERRGYTLEARKLLRERRKQP